MSRRAEYPPELVPLKDLRSWDIPRKKDGGKHRLTGCDRDKSRDVQRAKSREIKTQLHRAGAKRAVGCL